MARVRACVRVSSTRFVARLQWPTVIVEHDHACVWCIVQVPQHNAEVAQYLAQLAQLGHRAFVAMLGDNV